MGAPTVRRSFRDCHVYPFGTDNGLKILSYEIFFKGLEMVNERVLSGGLLGKRFSRLL